MKMRKFQCDDSEAAFEKVVKKVVKPKPEENRGK
jgi:hypothetical protein